MVSIPIVKTASLVAAAISLALALTLGSPTFLWMIPMLAIGWFYNLGLKSNGLSVVPYIIGFGILPAFVTLAGSEPSLPPAWVILVAALFGVAAHFANVLPDLIEDKQTGVKALPHLLGQRFSAFVIAFSAGFASLILVTLSQNLNQTIGVVGFGITLALAAVASFLALKPKPPKLVFYLLLIASLVNVVLLMLGS
jgi:4-hydroxybenzoate polyprenyltransferase